MSGSDAPDFAASSVNPTPVAPSGEQSGSARPAVPRLPSIPDYPHAAVGELPVARVPWQPIAARAALLVHDVQDYFLRPFGDSHQALSAALLNIAALQSHCRARGVPVFFTAQHGNQDQTERGLQRDFWGRGMPDDGVAPNIPVSVQPIEGDTVLRKFRYSALQRSPLEEQLKAAGRDQLIITGVYAHIGCLYTAADAFMRDIEPFLVADATADYSANHHKAALRQAASTCAVVINTQGILDAWP